jgi:hypothetical protein
LSIAVTSLAGCYGKFALTQKVYGLNGSVKDKYLRSGVTWAFVIVPVYGVSAFLDFILFNTIEFWSGNNPVAQGEKEFFYADGGEFYQVNARKSGNDLLYTIGRYGGGELIDTMDIAWDLTTGNSTVSLKSGDRITVYNAHREDNDVKVERSGPAAVTAPARLAAYRHP